MLSCSVKTAAAAFTAYLFNRKTCIGYCINVFAPKQRENNVRFIIMNYFREQAAQGMCVESKVEGRIVIK